MTDSHPKEPQLQVCKVRLAIVDLDLELQLAGVRRLACLSAPCKSPRLGPDFPYPVSAERNDREEEEQDDNLISSESVEKRYLVFLAFAGRRALNTRKRNPR